MRNIVFDVKLVYPDTVMVKLDQGSECVNISYEFAEAIAEGLAKLKEPEKPKEKRWVDV